MAEPSPSDIKPNETIPAGHMPPWEVGELPSPPKFSWRRWTTLIGPGLMMAGANIGGGEWLFGPAVTAQYGGVIMWIATMSIALQVFYNLEVMRYTLYCGEPIVTGYFRTMPGPKFWTVCYLILDFGAIWPYLASSAAVPLAAAIKGELPGPNDPLVFGLGYAIFLAALLPLIFGGKIYNSLEKVMIAKIVLVLGYLTFVAVFMCSGSTAAEIFGGFFRFGTVPLRAQTVIVGNYVTMEQRQEGVTYIVKGTFKDGHPTPDTSFAVIENGKRTEFTREECEELRYERKNDKMRGNDQLRSIFEWTLETARRIAAESGFYVRFQEDDLVLQVEGKVIESDLWEPHSITVSDLGSAERPYSESRYAALSEVPEQYRMRVRKLLENKGLEPVNIVAYAIEKGRLPDLNWSILAGFAAIAGAGGLSNAQFSNYARDKGWGMGPQVGAIPSAVGGKMISLSHVGKAFRPGPHNAAHWKGWIRHIVRDQTCVWMVGCFLGMALPAMLSLEFIRNAPVEGNKLAAMTADGMAQRAGWIFWPLTLLCGFMVLAPSQIANMDGILRRWTDVIWTGSKKLKHLEGNKVKYVYYGIMTAYVLWGLLALYFIRDPFVLTQASTVFMNLALGFSAFHTLWVNCTLLPRELRPNWLMRLGLILCGVFFLGICGIALSQQLPRLADWLATRFG